MTNPVESPKPHDFLAGMDLKQDERRHADELAQGALQVAREGGDVEAWLRAWVDEHVGRPKPKPNGSP